MTRDEYYAALNASKSELKHHGVKGQQLGEQNGPPYPLNESGKKKLAKQIEKSMKQNNHDKLHKTIDKSGLVEDAYSKIDTGDYVSEMNQLDSKAEKMLAGYSNNSEKYAAIAGIMADKDYGDGTLSSVSQNIAGYAFDDADQGFQNSVAVYLHDTNQVKVANDLVNKATSIDKKFENSINDYVHDAMGSAGLSEIKTNMYYKTAQKQVESYIRSKKVDEIFDAGSTLHYQLSEGADPAAWGSKSDKHMSDAKNVVSKMNPKAYTDYNGWNAFNKAIEDLGWSSTKYDEMTDAMWKQINNKIKNMR